MTELAPLLFNPAFVENWHMQLSERAALIYLLGHVKPDISIEIGTFRCGSLRPIAAASRNVYSFDIDPNQHRVAPEFSNVTFVTGDSSETLPKVIDTLNRSDRQVNFMLVDGSHEVDGVRTDLTNCLRYRPKERLTLIVMHDSLNPAVREGILTSPWSQCPYVHAVELDFIPGMLYDRADIKGQMWGGFAVAVMLPQERVEPLQIKASFEFSRLALLDNSIYKTKQSAIV